MCERPTELSDDQRRRVGSLAAAAAALMPPSITVLLRLRPHQRRGSVSLWPRVKFDCRQFICPFLIAELDGVAAAPQRAGVAVAVGMGGAISGAYSPGCKLRPPLPSSYLRTSSQPSPALAQLRLIAALKVSRRTAAAAKWIGQSTTGPAAGSD